MFPTLLSRLFSRRPALPANATLNALARELATDQDVDTRRIVAVLNSTGASYDDLERLVARYSAPATHRAGISGPMC